MKKQKQKSCDDQKGFKLSWSQCGLALVAAGMSVLQIAQAASTETRVAASRLVKTRVAWQGTHSPPVSKLPKAPAQSKSADRDPADLNRTIDELFSDDAAPVTPSPEERNQPRRAVPPPDRTTQEELPAPPREQANAANPRDEKVYRVDPARQLIEVAAGDLKPGVIYLHYDDRLGRQVWSYLQADHTFWRAFGPGTTQPISRFDFGLPPEETIAELKRIDPQLAFDVTSTGASAYLRLTNQNEWRLVRHQSVSSITELQTGRRWEKQWDRYLQVVHTHGDRWQYAENQFRPVP